MRLTDHQSVVMGLQKLREKLRIVMKILFSKNYVTVFTETDGDEVVGVELYSYGLEPMQIWDAHIMTNSQLLSIIAEDQIEQLNDMVSASDITYELCDAGFCPN
jgi:hypothetical protein